MNNKYLLAAIAVVVVLVAILFIVNRNNSADVNVVGQTNRANSEDTLNDNANTSNTNSTNTANSNANSNTNTTSNTNQSNMPDGNDVAVYEVTYNGTAYTPSQLTIKNGDVVVFKNASATSFWPASAPHPTHTNYPEFDPKKAIGPGQTWQFKFTKTGTWAFHDHLNPTVTGKITVQ
jgi:plastocyanin